MYKLSLIYPLLLAFLASGCASRVTTQTQHQANKPAGSNVAKADKNEHKELQNEIMKIASAAKGRVGVAAVVLETAESVFVNSRERFPMQSVYKLPIGMAVMRQVDDRRIGLEQRVRVQKSDFVSAGQHSPIRDRNPAGVELSVRELLRFMVSQSDGTACDVLLALIGVEAVGRYLKEVEVDEIVVANTEKEIGQDWQTQYRNWATPEGAVSMLKALHERRGLSADSKTLLLKLMVESPTGAKRLKGLLPSGTTVAHKTGTSGTLKGITAATNDIGLITLPNGQHLAIAVFVADSPANTETREEVIAKIAHAIYVWRTTK